MRRLRKNAKIRNIVRETKLEKDDLIYPIYFKEDLEGDEKEEISSLPGEYRYSLNSGIEFAKKLEAKGLKSIIVFGIPKEETKDEIASPDYSATGIVQKAVRRLKKETDLVVITDVCLCQYTSHGHCGMIVENDDTDDGIEILNDLTGKYVATFAKKKIAMRSGETDIAETVDIAPFVNVAKCISTKLKHIANHC
jgi:porphobilinogen synthase